MSETIVETDGDGRFAQLLDALALAGLFYLLSQILSAPRVVNWDCGALLFAGRMLLEGKIPYVDFYELNPPLILYLQVIPALLNRLIPIPLPLLFNLGVFGMTAGSWWLMRGLLRRSGAATATTAGALALVPVWISANAFSPGVWYAGNFGQREHLFALAVFPYLIIRWFRWEGWRVATGAAVVVGLGTGVLASLKPFFLLVILLPEVVWWIRHRRWRPLLRTETLWALGFVALYALHFALLPGPMREAYFHRWLPLIAAGYGVYNEPFTSLLRNRDLQAALVTAALPMLIQPREPGPAWRLTVPLSLATVAAALGFVIQHKGWSYHLLPATAGATATGVLVASELASLGRRSRASRLAALTGWGGLAAAGALMIVAVALLWQQGAPAPLYTDYHRAIVRWSEPGERVLFIDTNVMPQHPALIQVDRRPGSRYYGNVFTLPMFYAGVRARDNAPFPYHSPGVMPAEEVRLLEDLKEDIRNLKPRLVFIPRGASVALPRGFVIQEYLDTVGWTREALKGYRLLDVVQSHVVWRREAGE